MQPYIAQCCGSEQSVAQGMDEHIPVRMSHASFGVVYAYPPQYKWQSVGKCMHVVSVADPVSVHSSKFSMQFSDYFANFTNT